MWKETNGLTSSEADYIYIYIYRRCSIYRIYKHIYRTYGVHGLYGTYGINSL